MSSSNNHRLYTFTANLYLSPLQCGLQTAHVVSELSQFKQNTSQANVFNEWALQDKTIVICGAGNHKGVVDCFDSLLGLANKLGLPAAIFREDEQSMNGMATACGVIVPQKYWATTFVLGSGKEGDDDFCPPKYEYVDEQFYVTMYWAPTIEFQFIQLIKSFRLA